MADINVAIVGAGIAGLTAALRLLERGYAVTLIEQSELIGGKWGVLSGKCAGLYHEHAYHMFLNWYTNFWAIVNELGLTDKFEPRTGLKGLRPGDFPHRFRTLSNLGAVASIWPNLISGVEPIPDMFIGAYSVIDLMTQRLDRENFLDHFSVNGFMKSRLYATNRSARLHENTLAKAFANPSHLTSVSTYKTYVKNGLRYPVPMMWVLQGNCYEHFLKPLEDHLNGFNQRGRQKKFDQKMRTRVKRLRLQTGRVTGLETCETFRAAEDREHLRECWDKPTRLEEKIDYVILAVPPHALGKLVDEAVFRHAPELANVRKLRSEPMASLDLYLNKTLPNLPKEHVVLLDSKYDISFIDNAQLWPLTPQSEPLTHLNVVAANTDPLTGFDRAFVQTCLLEELSRYIPLHPQRDVDAAKTYTQLNTGEELFVNEVGSWRYRPDTTCNIPNLFIAGDYCRTCIDVVTIEGAVVSGLQAVQALQVQAIADQKAMPGDALCRPVDIRIPETLPDISFLPPKLLWAPYAYAARWWSWATDETQR